MNINRIAHHFNDSNNFSTNNGSDQAETREVTDTSSKNETAEKKQKTNWLKLTHKQKYCNQEFKDEKTTLKVTDISSRNEKVDFKRKKNLTLSTDQQMYCKRKFEDEEASKIEKKVEKKKRLSSVEKKKKLDINQSSENVLKLNNPIHLNGSSNLLNYFSKITSEQHEKEKLKNTKVIVKAEIHNPQDFQAPSLSSTSKKETSLTSKRLSISNKIMEECNEICVIHSETSVFSTNNEKLDSSVQPRKPKWSLKVQLQSSSAKEADSTDDPIFVQKPSSNQLKENVKNYRNIPKVLLPMKNKKIERNKSFSSADGNRKKDSIDLKTNIKTLKAETEKHETVRMKQISIDFDLNIEQNHTFDPHSKINSSSHPVCDEKNLAKLAPLFQKKLRTDPKTKEAHRFFLQSENNELTDSHKPIKIEPIIHRILPFPKVSHVNQVTLDQERIRTWNRSNRTINFTEKIFCKPLFNYSAIETVLKLKDPSCISSEVYESRKADVDHTLVELQNYYSDVQSLWKTISKCSESRKFKPIGIRVTKKKKSAQSNNPLPTSCLWTEKYKPENSHEVVGNEAAVLKLKTWLQNWQSSNTNEDYSSSEEFYISDCSLSNNLKSNQVAVLMGPHGSGKTASVYAVAQELGYSVLEVNASSKRPGKKILKEFEEATKSHRVRNCDFENSRAVPLCKIEKNDKNSQKSLIFMEDIDLIFEEDDGFVSATFQLASNTKRPIVMTLRNTCLHLPKIAPQQLQINFQPVVGKKMSALLQLIALAETGYELSLNCINTLCQDGDLRKSLIQLQYLLLSGKEYISCTSLAVDNLTWKSMQTYVYKPAIKAGKIRNKKQFSDDETMSNLVKHLDNFTLVSNLMEIDDPICAPINIKCEPSTSLIQNHLPYCALDSVSLDIGSWIGNSLRNSRTCKEKTDQSIDANKIVGMLSKEQFIIHVNSVLSKISLTADYQAITLDYLPSIRNICRSEEMRNQSHHRRGNRFFHYLQNSQLLNGTMKICDIFSAACKMFHEKDVFIS